MTIKQIEMRLKERQHNHGRLFDADYDIIDLIAALREMREALTLVLGALTNVSHNPDRPTIFDDGTCPPCHAAKRAAAVLAQVRDE
jgi:hypothetical protein